MTNNMKNPPTLQESSSFEAWEKAINLWTLVTDVKKEKQGASVVLSLTGKARDQVLELPFTDINCEDGVKNILKKLGSLYKKDTVDTAYETFERFIYFGRDTNKSMSTFINEFESRYNKAKDHSFELGDSSLAFFLLNQAKLSDENKKLIRATITKFEYEDMKSKLKKVFGSGEQSEKSMLDDMAVKVEEINLAEDEEAFYGRYEDRRNYRGYPWRGNYYRGNSAYRGSYSQRGNNFNFNKGNRGQNYRGNTYGKSNTSYPQDRRRSKCEYCESIFHEVNKCPEKVYTCQDAEDVESCHDIILYQSSLVTESQFKVFVAESAMSAILDSGASANVAGELWIESYLDGLRDDELSKVKYAESQNTFKFGNDESFRSLYKVTIPATIGENKILINTDVVETTIPLLLSKQAMKKADTQIDFTKDTVNMFGKDQDVKVTKSGHYAIPLNNSRKILKHLKSNPQSKISLFAKESVWCNKEKMARKLHAQFGHPPANKLLNLLERAGLGGDDELTATVKKVSKDCIICRDYAKPSPRPAVGLPHATSFNEMVGLDLKFFDENIILHLVDHLTRFSSACVIKSKQPKEIISGIMKSWVAIFGAPRKMLTDNGGEFVSDAFMKMAESFNIRLLNTSAESPWSNGLVERHNGVLSEMLHKIMAERKYDIHMAVALAIQAKNSLANVHGFSPAQLALGKNPQLPCVLHNDPPANESVDSSEIIMETLNCLRDARKAFIEAEASERIKRALNKNIRPMQSTKFTNGDLVYYKRKDTRRWRGPGKVIGQDSSCVLIKHGSQYVRAHATRVILDRNRQDTIDSDSGENTVDKPEDKYKTTRKFQPLESSSDSDGTYSNEEEEHDTPDELDAIGAPAHSGDIGMNQEESSPLNSRPVNASKATQDIRKGFSIEFMMKDGTWKSGEVVRRTGKATGKYSNCWEVKDNESGDLVEFDVKNDWLDWKKIENTDTISEKQSEIYVVNKEFEEFKNRMVMDAKTTELQRWKEQDVFSIIKNEGQHCLSTTWVITEKEKEGKSVLKARLVVRGYEEMEAIRSDSPTCSKDSVRMLLAVAVSKDWHLHSLDVKAAFLQGKQIERDIYIKPPKEFREKDCIWKLNKLVYGLCDASRSWYLKVEEVLVGLGMVVCTYDRAVFTYRADNSVDGIILIHVDDLLYFGSQRFLDEIIQPFKCFFKISREETQAFRYVGINIQQGEDHLKIEQQNYVDSLEVDIIPKDALRDPQRVANDEEKKIFRRAVGQLGWIVSMTRPEAAFSYCILGTVQNKPKMSDFKLLRKILLEIKTTVSYIRMNRMNLNDINLTVYCDASFGNLAGGCSQLGFLVMLCDRDNAIPISWSSKKAKRIARSTLTAETLAAAEAVDTACIIRVMLEDIIGHRLSPIRVFVDNKSLSDAVKTTNVLADKRLMIEMAALREMVETKEIIVTWIPTEDQLADVLTKSGVNKLKLVNTIKSGCISLNN